jgi:bacterioferritin-associated ferredoxin
MAVDRCVCWDVKFSTLIELARREGLTFEQLQQRTGCCTSCRMCEPYVRLALRTGQAVLPVLPPEQ